MSSRSCDNFKQSCEFWLTSTPTQCNCNENKFAFKVQTNQTKYQTSKAQTKAK